MIKRDYKQMHEQLIKTIEFYDTTINIQLKLDAERIAELERVKGSLQVQAMQCERKLKEL